MPGPVSDSFRGPGGNTPYVPTWMESKMSVTTLIVERLRAIDSEAEAWLAIEEAADTIEKLATALDLARNRLRAAAINEAPKQTKEYYQYSQWADEADAALAKIGGAQ